MKIGRRGRNHHGIVKSGKMKGRREKDPGGREVVRGGVRGKGVVNDKAREKNRENK